MTSANLFNRVRNALEHAHVPYMLTGSIASSVHGTPRATHNVDIVIAPDHDSLSVLLDSFSESEYYVSREAALAALSSEGQFNSSTSSFSNPHRSAVTHSRGGSLWSWREFRFQ